MTHGSNDGLSPGRRQAIIWINAGILLIGPLGTNFLKILIGIQTFSFKKMHLKTSSAKWRPFCLGLHRLWYCHGGVHPSHQWACLAAQYATKHYTEIMWLSYPWWRHQMETFSALLAICAGNSPITGEFPAQRPVTRSFDDFFDLRLDGRLSKHSWGWWLGTPSFPLWRQKNET